MWDTERAPHIHSHTWSDKGKTMYWLALYNE